MINNFILFIMNVGVTVLLRQYISTPFYLSFIEFIHTGIEYDGVEYCFTSNGIVEIKPKKFYDNDKSTIKEYKLGEVSRRKFYKTINILSETSTDSNYDLISRNCNCFTYELIKDLFNNDCTDVCEKSETIFSSFFIKYGRLEQTLLLRKLQAEQSKLQEEKDKLLINKIRLITEELIYGIKEKESNSEIQSILSNADTDYTDSFYQ